MIKANGIQNFRERFELFWSAFEFDSEIKSGRIQQVKVIYIIECSKGAFSRI